MVRGDEKGGQGTMRSGIGVGGSEGCGVCKGGGVCEGGEEEEGSEKKGVGQERVGQ